jgi:hypothetical protein
MAMKLWWIGGTVVGLLALSIYLAAVKRPDPILIESHGAVVVEEVPAASKAPALIGPHEVVDVYEVDSLLDPPMIPLAEPRETGPVISRVGYEEAAPPRHPPVKVKPIPRSQD